MVHDLSTKTDLLATAAHANPGVPQHSPQRNVQEKVSEPQASEVPVSTRELEQALTRVREVFQKADSRVEFSIDPDLDRVVVKIMDGESGTVIRQIPQQEVLELAKSLETPTGLLLHHKV